MFDAVNSRPAPAPGFELLGWLNSDTSVTRFWPRDSRSSATPTRKVTGRLQGDACSLADWGSCGMFTVPSGGWRSTPTSRPDPWCERFVPRFWIVNAARIGRSAIAAWKLVPKSRATAVAVVRPSLSDTSFAVNPAENRSEKFCEYVPEMNVSATE